MILVSFFSEGNVSSDEIKVCYMFECQSNENQAFHFLGGHLVYKERKHDNSEQIICKYNESKCPELILQGKDKHLGASPHGPCLSSLPPSRLEAHGPGVRKQRLKIEQDWVLQIPRN